MRKIALIMALVLLCFDMLSGSERSGKRVKVACIGNSITYGSLVPDREQNCYPSRLQQMLGDKYEVGNFGRPGATLVVKGHNPYTASQEYRNALAFDADIAVIHLGINDTDPRNWPNYGDRFVPEYVAMIDSLRAVNPDMRIMIARLTPISAKHRRYKSGTRDWRDSIQSAIEQVAMAAGVELIDFEAPLRDYTNLLSDGVHPNAKGAEMLARTVYGGITGDYGGLSMSPVYGSGMVLQRHAYLTIRGRADAGSKVSVTLDGVTRTTVADNRGDWSVTMPPLATGTGYEMTVTDGKRTLRFDNIAAGEVWVASGQSNMEFLLRYSKNSAPAISGASDPDLRFYDMKAIRRTNNVTWDKDALDSVNALKYYLPTVWTPSTPESAANMSAVGYYFGKSLRDSLNVPVGIILNAVGGSPAEAWIDIKTLEDNIPEVLVDWLGNDYLQPWVQERARKNMGELNADSRHPYEPGYLFASGIRPLDHYPVAGVIWYQGESNAHNTEVHERLFPLVVKSFREYFGDENLPFNFVQLSSLSRPSWSAFRNSQRLMADAMPGVAMAVSYDHGDSLDVHPTDKRPVGERLARIALHDTYGMTHVVPSGPRPVSARYADGVVTLDMEYADGLHTSDGAPLRLFELAGADGLFFPATASIENDKIIVMNKDIKHPRFVRYAWQPFARVNLVNGAELPASTFSIAVEEPSAEPEPGYEHGVSASYAGRVGDRVISVGGCNFPERPMAKDSKKRFYNGVYQAVVTDGEVTGWNRVGAMPAAVAYGASATTPLGMVLIGGTEADKALSTAWLLNFDGDNAQLLPLPALPFTMDNMYACAIGNKVYVAGGNRDGVPCNDFLCLDLDNLTAGWKKLKSFPGNPRVQPVLASGTDASGEKCVYMWGGFAGKGPGREASLETDGYVYSPSRGKWTPIAGPTDLTGSPVSVGGGVACTLPDGRIVVTGGVNKDVFLEALRNQAPDYLDHPIAWYRFNDHVFVFDPATGNWSESSREPGVARAGAAAVACADGSVVITGGELKPRIRTSETVTLHP